MVGEEVLLSLRAKTLKLSSFHSGLAQERRHFLGGRRIESQTESEVFVCCVSSDQKFRPGGPFGQESAEIRPKTAYFPSKKTNFQRFCGFFTKNQQFVAESFTFLNQRPAHRTFTSFCGFCRPLSARGRAPRKCTHSRLWAGLFLIISVQPRECVIVSMIH